jgi:hypothetical protein
MEKEEEERGKYNFPFKLLSCTLLKRMISGDWKYVITGTSNSSLSGIIKLDKMGTSEVPSNSSLGRPVNLHAFHTHIETKLPQFN